MRHGGRDGKIRRVVLCMWTRRPRWWPLSSPPSSSVFLCIVTTAAVPFRRSRRLITFLHRYTLLCFMTTTATMARLDTAPWPPHTLFPLPTIRPPRRPATRTHPTQHCPHAQPLGMCQGTMLALSSTLASQSHFTRTHSCAAPAPHPTPIPLAVTHNSASRAIVGGAPGVIVPSLPFLATRTAQPPPVRRWRAHPNGTKQPPCDTSVCVLLSVPRVFILSTLALHPVPIGVTPGHPHAAKSMPRPVDSLPVLAMSSVATKRLSHHATLPTHPSPPLSSSSHPPPHQTTPSMPPKSFKSPGYKPKVATLSDNETTQIYPPDLPPPPIKLPRVSGYSDERMRQLQEEVHPVVLPLKLAETLQFNEAWVKLFPKGVPVDDETLMGINHIDHQLLFGAFMSLLSKYPFLIRQGFNFFELNVIAFKYNINAVSDPKRLRSQSRLLNSPRDFPYRSSRTSLSSSTPSASATFASPFQPTIPSTVTSTAASSVISSRYWPTRTSTLCSSTLRPTSTSLTQCLTYT